MGGRVGGVGGQAWHCQATKQRAAGWHLQRHHPKLRELGLTISFFSSQMLPCIVGTLCVHSTAITRVSVRPPNTQDMQLCKIHSGCLLVQHGCREFTASNGTVIEPNVSGVTSPIVEDAEGRRITSVNHRVLEIAKPLSFHPP